MLEKLAATIAKDDLYTVSILGYPTRKINPPVSIDIFSYTPFKRISTGRWLARFNFLKTVLRIKPKLLIITTHELLFTSLILKCLTGCKLVYDIQENYYRNIIYSKTFPTLIKHFVAFVVRLKEKSISPFIDHFLLAESAYKNELGFPGQRYTILQNKASRVALEACVADKKSKKDNKTHLIFSGTLAGLSRAGSRPPRSSRIRPVAP
jgi:hypothetical protein